MPEPGLVRFGVGGQLEHCGWGARMLKLKLVRVKKSHPARTEQWDARVVAARSKALKGRCAADPDPERGCTRRLVSQRDPSYLERCQ
jgi:hypothetical protein